MHLGKLKRCCKKKQVILVDFFDTTMFRHIHSSKLMRQWSAMMQSKFAAFLEEEMHPSFEAIRIESIKELGGEECRIKYGDLIAHIYNKMPDSIQNKVAYEDFYRVSYEIDMYIDMGMQYPNSRMVKLLRREKALGKRIILVTDYYLPRSAIDRYLYFFRINLFDDIFCSSEFGATKAKGDLYQIVIKKIGSDTGKVLMVGDSRISDWLNAKKIGIGAFHYIPFFHKIKTRISKRESNTFSQKYVATLFRQCLRFTQYGEYGIVLYFFSKELYKYCILEGINSIGFLSRGGFFLKRAFEQYEKLSVAKTITTTYIKNSRKVNFAARENERDKQCLMEYLGMFLQQDKLVFVDEGWYGHGQDIIAEVTGWKIHGYYIGMMNASSDDRNYKKGILFSSCGNKEKSPYFGVFRTNLTFYEQILSAPHGSVVAYQRSKTGQIIIKEEWNEREKKLYYEYTQKLQEKMKEILSFCTVWNVDINLYLLAKCLVKSLLFVKKDRCNLLGIYSNSYFDNFKATSNKEFGKISMIDIKIPDLLLRPEECMRYFCKLKEIGNKAFCFIYPIIGIMIYCYCMLSIKVKTALKIIPGFGEYKKDS